MHQPTASGIAVIGWGLLIAGLAACGGGSATQVATPAPPTPSSVGAPPQAILAPCTVVTQDDANAFFGAPSIQGMPSSGSNSAFCVYSTADNKGHLSLNLIYDAKGARNAEDFVQLKSVNQDVPGLGDGAYFDSAIGALTVAKGPWIVRLSGFVQGANATLEKLKPLAQTALGRMP